ncbi:response regulator transcription factor [Metabacillus arenae]|uniref:Response regulator transcription factor n=1 Tax=Metabacillus arenae TaxID=2771434 RepID=A0A926NAG9_9BACI|nr:response regulator transcription factor [Metabacillus arenae]MBD1380587.1 response regulator transcription factor [Metabacillus arenae]
MRKKILVIDDEWKMRNLLKIYLEEEYQVMEAENGSQALSFISSVHFDLIILDIMLPSQDGWQICKEIRREKQTPILMLTARNEVKDKIYGLDIGADDYLGKPFEPEELVARIKALLRRSLMNDNHKENVLMFGDQLIIIETESRRVLVKGEKLDLTPKEYELLYLLANQPQRVFTRDLLLDVLWGIQGMRDHRTVDSHVKNLRIKAKEKVPTYNPIQTVWGVGYKFNPVDGEL